MANSLNYKLLSSNTEFNERVEIILLDVAYDVKVESDTTTDHSQRQDYADKIIANSIAYTTRASKYLATQAGIYQNMHVVTDDTLAADQLIDPSVAVGDLMYDGSKTPSAWWDGMDQGIKEQLELIYNHLAGINIVVP